MIDILLLVLIIAATALCIVLIYYIWKISNAVNAMQVDINELSKTLQPLLKSTTELSNNLKEITENARAHVDISKNVVLSIKDRVDTILQFEEKVRRGIEGPVMSFIKEITALNNGLNTFLSYFRKKDS
ncbi:MAG: hypothetical protein IH950_08050 [Bacteroidetes bacterium]|nr:hypothetical protein [Bacteroidota bacterium]MCH8033692.1 hypothetical protein [Bacteroidota bacterium]